MLKDLKESRRFFNNKWNFWHLKLHYLKWKILSDISNMVACDISLYLGPTKTKHKLPIHRVKCLWGSCNCEDIHVKGPRGNVLQLFWTVGKQISVLGCGPWSQQTCITQPLLSHSLKHCLRQSPLKERPFCRCTGFQVRSSSIPLRGKKIYKMRIMSKVKRASDLTQLISKVAQLKCLRQTFWAGDYPRGKSKHMASPTM